MHTAMLIVTMEPPAALEEEFSDWYDTEHFPQRRALPGFMSASRWVCLDGWPRYLALYDLASPDALATPEYHAVSGPNSTPWSRRMLPRTVGRQRQHGATLADGADDGAPIAGDAPRLLLASWPAPAADAGDALAARIRATARGIVGARQIRLVRCGHDRPEIWLVASFDFAIAPAQLAALQRVQEIGAATFNLYAPYLRQR
jgi:hypothetical protein